MSKEDKDAREEEREKKREDDPYVLCIHCCCAHEKASYKIVDGVGHCPDEGCNGTLFADGWSWRLLREENPELSGRGRPRA